MGSPRLNSDITLAPADVEAELNPGRNTNVQVDPISSEISATQEQTKTAQKKNERENKEALQTIKSAIIVSGIVVAVVGAAFAITKKLREK